MPAEKVFNYLKKYNIPVYSCYEHIAVFSMEEANELDIPLDGTECKNLFLKSKKDKRYFLISVIPEKKTNLKALEELLSTSRLTFGNEEELSELLGVSRGSVTPMGLINDTQKKVEYYMDRDFETSQRICFHPNTNTMTMTLERDSFMDFLTSLQREIRWIDI